MSEYVMNTADDIEDEVDIIYGGGSRILPSNVYDFIIETAYILKSSGGALGLALSVKAKTGEFFKDIVYFTTKDDTGNVNYYINKKTKKKEFLMGYNQAHAIGLLACGKGIAKLMKLTEKKVINLWDFGAKKEMPTTVDMVSDLEGKSITLGIIEKLVNAQVPGANKGDKYEDDPSGKTKKKNSLDKIFRTKDHLTYAEILSKETEPKFYKKWLEANEGKVIERLDKDVKAIKPGTTTTTNTKASDGASADDETESLFA